MKMKSGIPYGIERRTQRKKGKDPLSGYAMDITIRVNAGGAYFLQDHNADRNVMPFNNREEFEEILIEAIRSNHREHFGSL